MPRLQIVWTLEDGEWNIDLMRPLTGKEFELWGVLMLKLNNQQLSHGRDVVLWAFDKSNAFTTNSLYRFMIDGGIRKKDLWKSMLPLHIKVFLWQVYNSGRHGA